MRTQIIKLTEWVYHHVLKIWQWIFHTTPKAQVKLDCCATCCNPRMYVTHQYQNETLNIKVHIKYKFYSSYLIFENV